MLTVVRWSLVCAVLLVAACGKEDNSADTDRAGQELRKAQQDLSLHGKSLADNQEAIEQKKRDLAREQQQILREQQDLADKQKLLEQQRLRLGAAQENLGKARAAYAAAIKERFAKLDAALATLGTRTDARSRDAVTGLRARRDQLSAKLATLTQTVDANWNEYTSDVDTTFDAIEQDLHQALK
jgi:DNA repair exonuclease SbcCD ATPase subunit